ncbi:RnfABCDGE type electron transport complex subunit D [Paenibacillus sabinae]|uniref:RnfABCDGE type electron transport complex subunit D n=1 Tax=Paenibacillus sabinae T27 TaxID=1268072 RepID=X4ZJP1_9BACL|nr:RnfABCDGE type electron transport complex subunit D [Paenibacillus sabinae]AHV99651.1 hypothetical protein PSAB_23820 [Paenibacillus sabinae T27]
MTFKQWIKSPKAYVAAALAVYLLIASLGTLDPKGLINGAISVGVSIVLDILFSLIEKRKRILPDGAAVTGLIIALILGTTTSWPEVALTAAVAILSKHFLVYKKKPVFNPAAFGLLMSVIIFGTGQSWWGAFGDLPVWMIGFLLIGGYAVTNRVNKYPQLFSFFAFYFVLQLLMGLYHAGDASDALRPPFINAALFFGFFMLTDPPTSPIKVKDQIIFGALSALAGSVVYALFGGLIYLFIGLLIGNLYKFLISRFSADNAKAKRPAVTSPKSY